MTNNLKYITASQLIASVANDLPSLDAKGMINSSRLIKTIMLCNETLGIPIFRKKECFIKVKNFKADLPVDFWKVVFVCAISHESFGISNYRDPFNNTVTLDMKKQADCEASMQVISEGNCVKNCPMKIIKRCGKDIVNTYTTFTPLSLSKRSSSHIHSLCMNKAGNKYTIDIDEELIETPFREGELYMMYFTAMQNEEGEAIVPFHPLITNWYEWCIKEKIFQDALFNSDENVVNKLRYVSQEKAKYWLDAINFTMEPFYNELQQMQKKNEQIFYDTYYKNIM